MLDGLESLSVLAWLLHANEQEVLKTPIYSHGFNILGGFHGFSIQFQLGLALLLPSLLTKMAIRAFLEKGRSLRLICDAVGYWK